MDVGVVQSALTVFFFVVFVGIVLWAWSGRRKRSFDEAARLPLDEDEAPAAGAPRRAKERKDG